MKYVRSDRSTILAKFPQKARSIEVKTTFDLTECGIDHETAKKAARRIAQLECPALAIRAETLMEGQILASELMELTK